MLNKLLTMTTNYNAGSSVPTRIQIGLCSFCVKVMNPSTQVINEHTYCYLKRDLECISYMKEMYFIMIVSVMGLNSHFKLNI
jgi:hypothetical protein